MAFIANDFSPVGAQARRGVGIQQFSYTSPDTLATIKASGYFDEIAKLLDPNAAIIVASSTGGTVAYTIIFIAAISALDVVTTSALDINAA